METHVCHFPVLMFALSGDGAVCVDADGRRQNLSAETLTTRVAGYTVSTKRNERPRLRLCKDSGSQDVSPA